MRKRAEATTTVDSSLRFALFGLECVLGVEFSAKEVERVFSDSCEDQVSAKDYVFVEAVGARVSGRVNEYEPETILLRIEGTGADQSLVNRIVERANYQALRLCRTT